mmetsp:Transcript_49651/g.118237  ORF Transcript_49651/g.118237 Transcript_49651/m.118237 type:complete len:645 (+) Transcript_49651:98-2032(+)
MPELFNSRTASNIVPAAPAPTADDDVLKDGLEEDLWPTAVFGAPSRGASQHSSIQTAGRNVTCAQRIVAHRYFTWTIWALVAMNTVQMGVEADYPDNTDLWFACENFFTLAFALEMCIKICAMKIKYFRDKANLLDAAIVILAIIDVWIFTLIGEEIDLQSISILRLLRLLRLVRVIKLVKQWRKVLLVLHGLFAAMQATVFVGALLGLSIYCCAIFCVSIIGRQDMYPGYTEEPAEINEQEVMANFNPHLSFGSMGRSMLTLFSIAIFAEWTEIVRPVYLKQPGLVLFFVAFALFVCFGVMNVIIGMIVDSVIDYSNRIEAEEEEIIRTAKRAKVHKIMKLLDSEYPDLDHEGGLRSTEVAQCMRNESMKELLKGMDLPAGFTGREMMDMLDNNGSGTLQRAEFARNLIRLVENGSFQQSCMMQSSLNELKRMMRESTTKIEARLQDMEDRMEEHFGGGSASGSGRQTTTTPREKRGSADRNAASEALPAADRMPASPRKCPEMEAGEQCYSSNTDVAAKQLEAVCSDVANALKRAWRLHVEIQQENGAAVQKPAASPSPKAVGRTVSPTPPASTDGSKDRARAGYSEDGKDESQAPHRPLGPSALDDPHHPQPTARPSSPPPLLAPTEANMLPGAISSEGRE